MRNKHFISLLISFGLLAGYAGITEKCFAQIRFPVPSKADIRDFEESKTYIVKEDMLISDYNLAIEEAVDNHWVSTDTEIISAEEFKDMRTDESASFVYKNPVYFDEDKTYTKYDYLFLSMGDKSGEQNKMRDLCAVPLAVKDTKQEEYVYKTGLILEFMQEHINVCKKHPELDKKDVVDFYSSREINLDEKELWLLKDEVEPKIRSRNDMKSVYPHDFRFVEEEDIKSAIEQGREDVLVLHLIKAGENRFCFKLIVSTDNAGLYYYDYHKTRKRKPSLLLKRDIRKFQR
ncbi:MAG: hypothetical protein R6V32_09825 [Bacteroidales bacterium]